jgi:hypothetical protein
LFNDDKNDGEKIPGCHVLGITKHSHSGGGAQWASHPPKEQEDPGSNPARV